MVKRSIYTSGGAVQAGQGVYLPREADDELLQLCLDRDFAYVLTSRQMGKSSLMIQTARALKKERVVPIVIDLTDIGAQGIAAEDWYLGFLLELEDKLEQSGKVLETDVYEWWKSHGQLTLTQRFNRFFRAVLLTEVTEPIVVFVDEIDTSLSLDFTDDFFIGIRSFYTARAQDAVFNRLSFVLIGVATPSDLILDARRTPFNIGDRVDLTDFTAEDVRPLSEGLGLPEPEAQQVMAWVLDWTGGHPYLTQRLCIELSRHPQERWTAAGVSKVVELTFLGETGKQDNHLKFVRDMLTERAPNPLAVLKTYRDVYSSRRVVPDDEQSIDKSHLKLSGVVKRERDSLEVRNLIYSHVFDRRWIRQVWPEGWWDRIKPAMPVIVGLTAIVTALSGVSWYAIDRAAFAEKQQKKAEIVAQAALVLNWIPTPIRATKGLITAIATLEQSEKFAPEVMDTARASLLSAVQITREKNRLKGHTDEVTSVAVSKDGNTIISGSRDNTVRLWDREGNPIGEPFEGHTGSVTSVAVSIDGNTIISGSRDNTVRLWDRQGNSISEPFEGHTDEVTSVAVSTDGSTIISGSRDNTVRLWDREGNPIGEPFEGHTGGVTSVAVSTDGNTIVSGDGGRFFIDFLSGRSVSTVRLWDREGNPIGEPFEGHTGSVTSVAVSPDGNTIVSGGKDFTVRLWDREGMQRNRLPNSHTGSVTSVAVSPGGNTIISGGSDSTVRLWDRQWNPIGEPFEGHTGGVTSVAVSTDGNTIVSGSWDSTVRLWDREGNPIGEPFEGHTGPVVSVAVSTDGNTIISGSWDSTVRLWDRGGNPIGEPFEGHIGKVTSVAVSIGGSTIISGGSDSTVRLWDREGNPIGEPFEGHTGGVTSVAVSIDGNTIISGSWDNTVRLWDREGNPIGEPFEGHAGPVSSVAVSPDGSTIISGSGSGSGSIRGRGDSTVRLWDRQGNPMGEPFEGHTDEVTSVAVSTDGNTIVSGSWDSTVRLWPASWNTWLEIACNRLRHHSLWLKTQDSDFTKVASNAMNACDPIWNGTSGPSNWLP